MFVDQEPEFYGGQGVNEAVRGHLHNGRHRVEWLPFMEYAYSSGNDTFGAAVVAKGDLAAGLDDWQERLSSTESSRASRSTVDARPGEPPRAAPPNPHLSEGD